MGAFDDLIPQSQPGAFDDLIPKPSAKKPIPRTWGEAVGDTGVQLAEGVNTIAGAVPNLVAPESRAAEFFRDNADYWRDKQSDPLKFRIAKADQAIDAAGQDGVISQIVEAAGQYFSDPGLASRFVTTNLPSMIPGIGAAKLTQAAALARGASAMRAASLATTAAGTTNAVLNAGGARGDAYDDIKRTLERQGYTPDEAERLALQDSRLVAAVGALTGFVSGKTGLEHSLVGGAATKGALKAGAASAAAELAGEQIEEVTPKLATNFQAGQYDGRSLGKDVGRTIVETAIGSGPGSAVAGVKTALDARAAGQAAEQGAPAQSPAASGAQEAATPTVGAFDDLIPKAGTDDQKPAARPEVRLAELDLLAQTRDLTPQESAEAQTLLSRLDEGDTSATASQVSNVLEPAARTSEGQQSSADPANSRPGTPGAFDDLIPGKAAPAVDGTADTAPAVLNHHSRQVLSTTNPGIQANGMGTGVQTVAASGIDPNLQNRDRSRAASVAQMAEIARNPDYLRLATSRTPDAGAPMVFAVADDLAKIPKDNEGRSDIAVMADGQRVPFRYAVVDAAQVDPSHFADGRLNPAFAAEVPGTIKALNNARTAGLRAAYELGSTAEYKRELIADAEAHGVSPQAIERTPNPILVRVYSERSNTTDMAAKSQGQALGMSPGELARQDAPLIDAGMLSAYRPGDVAGAANRDFVRAFVGKMHAAGQDVAPMMTGDGTLSPAGRQRIQAALMQAAYGDADLVEDLFDSLDTDIKAIGEALKIVAGEWANMRDFAREGAINPQADITGNLLQALNLVRKARRERVSLYDLTRQPDLLTGEAPDPLTIGALRLFYRGQYLTSAHSREHVVAALRDYLDAAMDTTASADMFGQIITPTDILNRHNEQGGSNEQDSTQEGGRDADGSGPLVDHTGEALPEDRRQRGQEAGLRTGEDRARERDDAEAGVLTPRRAVRFSRRPADEVAPVSRDPVKTPLYEAVRQLSRFDESFRMKTSQATDLPTIAREMTAGLAGQNEFLAEPSTALHQGNRKPTLALKLKNKAGDPVKILDIFEHETGRPFVVIGNSELGQNVGGSLAYQIAFAWAHNNAKRMRPDPAGLTVVNRLRRTEAMISSALRFGTTKHLEPHQDQYIALTPRAQSTRTEPQDTHYSGNPELFNELEELKSNLWKDGDDADTIASNVQHLLEASGQLAVIREPAIRTFAVDHGELARRGMDGRVPLADASLADAPGVVEILGVRLQPEVSGVGPSTLKRYAVVSSVARAIAQGQRGAAHAADHKDDGVGNKPATRALRAIREVLGPLDRGPNEQLKGIFYARGARGGGLSKEAVQSTASLIASRWSRAPEIVVAQDMRDVNIPQAARDEFQRQNALGATGAAEGFYYGGKVYLLASELGSVMDVARVLFHEALGHHGLRGAFGTALDPILDQLAIARPELIKERADRYGLDLNNPAEKRMAAEEALAQLAQDKPEIGYVRRAVAAIRTWLRENVPGLQDLALTDAEIIRSFILPARGFVEQGESPSSVRRASPAFSRSTLGGPEPDPIKPAQQNAWTKAKAKVMELASPQAIDRLIYEFQDKYIDLKNLREHIQALDGTISDLNDAYLGEELYHKRLAKRTEDFLAAELKPLLAGLRSRGVKLEDFERFLHARHAPEANKALAERNPNRRMIDQGKAEADAQVRRLELDLQRAKANGGATKAIEDALVQARAQASKWVGAQAFRGEEAQRMALSGMSDEEAKTYMDNLTPRRRKDLEELAGQVDKIQAKTLDLLQQYGLMDKAALDTWRGAYRFYVPLHRDEAHAESDHHPIGQGFSVKGGAARSRIGSTEKVTNILAHIAMQREAALTRGEKNNVVKKLYLMAAQNPDVDFWSIDNPPKIKTIDPNTGFVRMRVDPAYKHLPHVLMVRIAGRDQAIVFNEHNPQAVRLAEAMKNLDVGDLHVVLGLAAKGTRWFASVNTQYNPIFGLINFARDVQAGLLNLSTTELSGKTKEVAAYIPAAMRAIYRERRGKSARNAEWARLWDEFQEVGGTTGYRDLYADAKERTKALEAELAALDRGEVSKAAHAVVDWLSHYNETMENSVRLAAYKVALDQGMSKERAASLSKNLTVNFNRKGRQAREIGALYAFFNAAIQGTARMAETLKGPLGRRIVYGGVLLGVTNALIGMAAMGGGDDDEPDNWEKVPEFVKERSIVIPLGREDYLTVPLPLGFHVLPNIGRLSVEFALGGKEKSAGRQLGKLLQVFADAFNPLGGAQNLGQIVAPTVIDPAVALMQNRDWTGRPIYRENVSSLGRQPGHKMAKDSASTPSRLIAEAVNRISGGTEFRPGAWSPTPDQLDYVVGQLTGGLGRELLKVNQTIAASVTGDELPPYKIPLVGRLYGNTRGQTGQSERFYENIRTLNEIENEYKGLARTGKDYQEFRRSEPLVELVPLANGSERTISQLRAQRRLMVEQQRPGYQNKVREIDAKIGETMARLNDEVSKARKRKAP